MHTKLIKMIPFVPYVISFHICFKRYQFPYFFAVLGFRVVLSSHKLFVLCLSRNLTIALYLSTAGGGGGYLLRA